MPPAHPRRAAAPRIRRAPPRARAARAHRPIAMFIDDAHWGDADSAAFLAELIHPGEPAILVVVAHRPEDYLGVIAKLKPPAGRPRRHPRARARHRSTTTMRARSSRRSRPIAARAEAVVDGRRRQPARAHRARARPRASGAPAPTIADLVRAASRSCDPTRRRCSRCRASRRGRCRSRSRRARRASSAVTTRRRSSRPSDSRPCATSTALMILQPAHDHVRLAVLAGLDVEAKAYWHEALAIALEELRGDRAGRRRALARRGPSRERGAPRGRRRAARRGSARVSPRRRALRDRDRVRPVGRDRPARLCCARKAEALVAAGQLDAAAAVVPARRRARAGRRCRGDRSAAARNRGAAASRPARRSAARRPHSCSRTSACAAPLGKPGRRPRLSAPWFATKLRGLDFIERSADACSRDELLRVDVLVLARRAGSRSSIRRAAARCSPSCCAPRSSAASPCACASRSRRRSATRRRPAAATPPSSMPSVRDSPRSRTGSAIRTSRASPRSRSASRR